VPDDGPPLDRHCQEQWPPGWGPATAAGAAAAADRQQAGTDLTAMAAADGASSSASQGSIRKVLTERDVFELLSLPYQEPYQRNCP
jgi:hypothetical protein